MNINASITSIRVHEGVRGDGEKVLGDNILAVRIPCELRDPSSYRIQQDETRGLGTTHLLVVPCAALRARQSEPERLVGARVEFYRHMTSTVEQGEEIINVRETSTGNIELTLGQRRDQAVIGGAL